MINNLYLLTSKVFRGVEYLNIVLYRTVRILRKIK